MLKRCLILFLCLTATLAQGANIYDDEDEDGSGNKKHIKVYTIKEGVTLTTAQKFKYGKPRIVIKIVEPELSTDMEEDEASVTLFNNMIDKLVNDAVSNYMQAVVKDNNRSSHIKSGINNNFYTDFDTSVVNIAKQHIISIRMTLQGFFATSGTNYHDFRVLNYSLEDLSVINLGDLFLPDSDYLAVISDYVREQLYGRLSDKSMIESGTDPREENFATWNLRPLGLLFTFPSKQVAPEILGAQTVLVPYSVLRPLLSPEALLKNCRKQRRRCVRNNFVTGGFIDEAVNTKPTFPLLSKR